MRQIIREAKSDTIDLSSIPEEGIYAYLNHGGSPILLVRPEHAYRFCSLSRPLKGSERVHTSNRVSAWFNNPQPAIAKAIDEGYTVFEFDSLYELCRWILQKRDN